MPRKDKCGTAAAPPHPQSIQHFTNIGWTQSYERQRKYLAYVPFGMLGYSIQGSGGSAGPGLQESWGSASHMNHHLLHTQKAF